MEYVAISKEIWQATLQLLTTALPMAQVEPIVTGLRQARPVSEIPKEE
jgi:hypothetical protein